MPSTRRNRKSPEALPEFFVDRSLGRLLVPAALRSMGFQVVTLWEAYGRALEQTLDDDVWIVEQSEAGRVLLTADRLYADRHREAIRVSRARIFRTGSAARDADVQIAWIGTNIHRIVQRSRKRGPYIDVIRERAVERAWPPESPIIPSSLDFK